MPRYVCNNKNCPRYKMTTTVLKTRIKVVDDKTIDSGAVCPKCGEIMGSDNPGGFTTFMGGGENVCKK